MPQSYHHASSSHHSSHSRHSTYHNSIPPHRPNESTMRPFPPNPPPCHRPRSICPDHAHAYRALIRFIEAHQVRGPEEMEFIYSRHRGPEPWADMVRHDMRRNDVSRGYLEHYGVLRGPGLLPGEEGYGRGGNYGMEGSMSGRGSVRGSMSGRGSMMGSMRGGMRGGGRGTRRGGRMGQMMDDDAASVASWGAASRPPGSRAPSVAGSNGGRGRRRSSY